MAKVFSHPTINEDTCIDRRGMNRINGEWTKDHDQEGRTCQVNPKERPRRMNLCARSVDPQEGMNPSQSMNQALMTLSSSNSGNCLGADLDP
ncbi:hypothetical protein QQ045_003139 [Rhodiola kirilowii]